MDASDKRPTLKYETPPPPRQPPPLWEVLLYTVTAAPLLLLGLRAVYTLIVADLEYWFCSGLCTWVMLLAGLWL